MSENIAVRLKKAGYPLPKLDSWQAYYEPGCENVLHWVCGDFIDDFGARILVFDYAYAPPVEELLQHPFFKLSSVSFESHKKQWQLKTFESQRENRYDYGENLADLLGTLLAEHLEKESNGKTDNVNG